MAYNAPTRTLTLPAAVINGIAQSQSKGSAGNFTLNGSLVSAGVANLVVARIVLFTFAADETGHNFTVTGTDRNGRAQSEVVAGTATTAVTKLDYLTVTQVAVDAATTGTVQVGTNATGSSTPIVLDTFINPGNYGVAIEISGTVTTGLEGCMVDLTPLWDFANNSVMWYPVSGFDGLTAAQQGTITGPFTAIRLTNTSGTGTAIARLVVPFIGGA